MWKDLQHCYLSAMSCHPCDRYTLSAAKLENNQDCISELKHFGVNGKVLSK